MSKRKRRQEVDLVLLFELFSRRSEYAKQSNQIDIYQEPYSSCIYLTISVIGLKLANQIAHYMV